jgi:hypothetical protein
MNVQRLLAAFLFVSMTIASESARALAPSGLAGMITGFEAPGSPSEVTNPAGYQTGSVLSQDGWTGANLPRVQTAAEISAELAAAGLNPANPVRSGNQALLAAKVNANVEGTGYIASNVFQVPLTDSKVVVDYWARPLGSGLGADPSGAPPGNGKTIGELQGNTFVGIADDSFVRAAAVRFGVEGVPPNRFLNVTARYIDFASASAGPALWVRSAFNWQPNQWYNFRLNLDYDTKKYDFFIDGMKVNAEPIRFYNEASQAATRLFVSRGTNQAGPIVDDVNVRAVPEPAVVAMGLQVALLLVSQPLRRPSRRMRSRLS